MIRHPAAPDRRRAARSVDPVVRLARRLVWPRRRAAAALVLVCVGLLGVPTAEAERPIAASGETSCGRAPAFDCFSLRPDAVEVIGDVALQAGGVLQGRMACSRPGTRQGAGAGWRVRLMRGKRNVAETATGPDGDFALRNLSGGLYQVVVNTPDGPIGRFYRVWTPDTAPPCASPEVEISLGGRVVLGQSPFPMVGFPRAATITAIAAGAIAAPIIYHNAKLDNRVPASP